MIRNALVSVHEAAPDLVQETVDMASGQTTLHILAQAAQKSTITSPNHASDFYRDPNLRESTRLRDVVQEALERASALFSAWPEQMVLSEIVDRCKALLAVPATASVAKLLVFVESLLFKISDWEAYASRETSLQKSTERLTALVVDWRRLELQSWAGLLHTQEMAFRQPVAEWWFRLYEICVEGPRGWDKQAQRLPYIRNVLQAAQMLLDSSPAGQFADRLALMGSFARFTDCLQAYSPIYSSIATALGNLVAFYAPQASRIRAFLQAEKKKIERDVHEVIRLASWKDVNVYALKASAQKSHRQLYKRVRALRKVLETPVARFAEGEVRDERIMPEGGTDALSALHLVHEEYTVLPDDRKYEALSTLPQAIRSAEATVRRLEQVVAAQQSSLAAAASPRPLQVLADSIIQRSQELRSQVPTGSTKEERAKQAKTLTDRKRKAWSSLLSEAKRIGLSPRPSTTLVEQLSSLAVLFDAGPICSDKIIGWHARHQPIAQDIDRYFYRMCALMPNIRAAASHHHPDVASAQLQFSSGFLDSALKIIHSGRKNLQKDLHTLRLLHLHLIKLKQLAKDGIAPVQFIDIPAVVRTYHNTISILRDALQEILDYGTEHSCFMSETDISAFASVEEAIKKCSNQAIAEADRLATLDDAGRTEAPISKTSLEIFHNALETWHGIQETVSVCLSENSRFAYLLQPMLSWMMETSHSLIMNPSESVVAPAKGTTLEAFAHAMSSILVAIQELHALPYQPCVEDVDEYASGGLMLQFQQLAQRTGSLRLGDVEGQLVQFAHSMALSTTDPDEIPLATQLVTR